MTHRCDLRPRPAQTLAVLLWLVALLSVPLQLLPAQAAPAGQNAVSTINITIDQSTSRIHQVVHLTATVAGGLSQPSGSLAFLDNGQPIASVPLDRRGVAALGVASFKTGSHTLSATYSGDAVYLPNTTTASQVLTIVPELVMLTASVSTTATATGLPVTVRVIGLPSRSTGRLLFANEGGIVDVQPIAGQSQAGYVALGDSITYGAGIASDQTYPALFAARMNLTVVNLGNPGYVACDVLPGQLMAFGKPSTQLYNPLYSLMIGTNNAYHGVDPVDEGVFRTCHLATLAFLGTPREYKVLAGDDGVTVFSGRWNYTGSLFDGTWRTLLNATGSGTVAFKLTTSGAPIYLWYLVQNAVEGSFSVSVDGLPTGPATETGKDENSVTGAGFGLLRLPALAGEHTIEVTALSGSVGILGVGTAPSPGPSSTHPTVLVSDLPNPSPSPGGLSQSAVDAYSADAQADQQLLAADGLDLRFVSTHDYLTTKPANFQDYAHPSVAGHQLLAQAFLAQAPALTVADYISFENTPATGTVIFRTAGQHGVGVAYTGDANFGSAGSPLVPETVVLSPSTTTLTASAATVLANAPLTLSATVAPSDASGSVSLYDGPTQMVTLPVMAGGAVFTTTSLTIGAHTLSASYTGDQMYSASASPSIALQVVLNQPTLSWSPPPVGGAYGSLTSVTTAITPASASGSVTIQDSFVAPAQSGPASLALGTAPIMKGQATLLLPSLGVGQHSLTAVYAGDAYDMPATGSVATVSISPLPTVTTLSVSAAKITLGTPLGLTANVSPAAPGTITFTDNATGATVSATLAGGTATASLSGLIPGVHTFTAAYAGDSTHSSSISTGVQVTVTATATVIVLAMPAAGLKAGTPLTLIATLTPTSATGLVTFSDQAQGVLGQVQAVNGAARLTLSSPAAGSYSVTAAYAGDAYDAASVSAAVSFSLERRSTTLSLGALPASITPANTLSLIANVTPATATGPVLFKDAGTVLGTAQLQAGSATLSLMSLPPGAHTIAATYSGDALDEPAAAAAATLNVTGAATSTALSLAQNSVVFGLTAGVNVRVATSAAVIPTGTITLRSGGMVLASAALANASSGIGYATLSIDTGALSPGTYPLTAIYSGDANDGASDSSATPVSLLVESIPVTAALTLAQTQLAPAQSVSLSVILRTSGGVNPQSPAGSVAFLIDGVVFATIPAQAGNNGTASAAAVLPPQAVGAHRLSANFLPAGFFAAASAPAATLTVTPPLTLVVTAPALSAAAGTNLTTSLVYTPLSGFSGAVTTTCSSPVAYLTCTVAAPPSLSAAAGPVTVPVSIGVARGLTAALNQPPRPAVDGREFIPLACLALPLLSVKRRRRFSALAVALMLGILLPLTGCLPNAESNNYLPPGAQTLKITATAAGVSVSTDVTVTIHE